MTKSDVALAMKGAAPNRAAVLRHGRAFLAWWLSELAGLLPDSMRTWLSEEGVRAAATFDEDTLRLSDLRGGRTRILAELNLARMTGSEVHAAVGRAFRYAGLSGSPVVLGLPERLILRCREYLPAVAERRLADILRLRLESTAPMPPGTFYWGYRITGPAADGRLPVECVLVKAETVDALSARVTELGIEISGVFPANDLPGQPALNLLPERLRRESLPLWSTVNRRLGALAGVLALLALGLTLYRQEAALTALNDELTDLRSRAKSVLALRTGASEQMQSLRAVREIKASAPPLMGILNEVSRILPDSTWVSNFRLRNGEVWITGQARSASSLIGLIEGSPLFANARFGSPVVRDPQTGAERFNIQFDWVKGASASPRNGGR